MIRTILPEFQDQLGRDFAHIITAAIDSAGFQRFMDEAKQIDADADAAKVTTPTLLITTRNNPNFDQATTRRVAGLIKNSRVAVIDSAFEMPQLVQRFFDDADWAATASQDTAIRAGTDPFRIILFTDVEGSTALTDRLGDAKARELLREHERITRDALKAHGGSEVKTMGDGFMASFGSATKALECAIAIQQAFAGRNESAEEPIKVRIGLNAGEPIAEDDPGGRGDLFGTAVNMAARIASKAEAGEILVADVVRQLVAGKEFLFSDRGDTELRGFEDPVRVYEVRWRE
jgi:class 3 adenylate cyclase